MKNLFLLFFLILATVSHAQQVRLGPQIKNKGIMKRYAGSYTNFHFVAYTETASDDNFIEIPHVLKFDKNFEQKEDIVLDFSALSDFSIFYAQIWRIENRPVWLLGAYNGSARLGIAALDDAGKVNKYNEIVELSDFDYNKDIPVPIAASSNDGSTYSTLIMSRGEKKMAQACVQVFDKSIKNIWGAKIKFTNGGKGIKMKDIEPVKIAVSNKGDVVYFLAKVFTNGVSSSLNKADGYELKLFKLAPSKEAEEINMEISREYPKEATMEFDNDGNLICSGFLSNKKNNGLITSVFVMKLNTDGKIIKANKKQIQYEARIKMENYFDAATGKTEYNYRFTKRIFRSDSTSIIAIEKNTTIPESYSPGLYMGIPGQGGHVTAGSYIAPQYSAFDIILLAISPNLDIDTIVVIPKTQHYDLHNGFCLFTHGDEISFLYNDHSANLEKSIEDNYKKKKSLNNKDQCALALTTLDKNNRLTRKQIWKDWETHGVLIPHLCSQTDENTIFIGVSNSDIDLPLSKPRYQFGEISMGD